jgi:hypothetical protein
MIVLERAIAHYQAQGTGSIDVPEWGEPGKPLRVFFKVPNGSTVEQLLDLSKGRNIEYSARLVAKCSLDESGERMFKDADYKDLMIRVHPSVVGSIAKAIADNAKLDMSHAAQAEAEGN